jgi:probable F420-dependent oxidoreductase
MSRSEEATPYRGSPDGRMDRLARRGGIPDPLIWFAFVAGCTTRIRFGTGVLILPEHQPVVLAKAAATLDHLASGRLMLGVGVGELPEEYAAVGMQFSNRGRRTDEYLDAMRLLWSEDEATFDGRYVRFDRMECRPWPEKRSIPIHIGGGSEAAIHRAARRGDGYFPFVAPEDDPHEVLPVLLRRLGAECRSVGRDVSELELTSGGARTVEDARWYADEGIHRLTVAIRSRTIGDMRDELARLGDELVAPTTDL